MLFSHEPNKALLIPDTCRTTERNGNSISPDVTDDAIENDWTKLVSAIFRQFSNCFGLLDFWYCMISTIHVLITIYGIWNRAMTLHALDGNLDNRLNIDENAERGNW